MITAKEANKFVAQQGINKRPIIFKELDRQVKNACACGISKLTFEKIFGTDFYWITAQLKASESNMLSVGDILTRLGFVCHKESDKYIIQW